MLRQTFTNLACVSFGKCFIFSAVCWSCAFSRQYTTFATTHPIATSFSIFWAKPGKPQLISCGTKDLYLRTNTLTPQGCWDLHLEHPRWSPKTEFSKACSIFSVFVHKCSFWRKKQFFFKLVFAFRSYWLDGLSFWHIWEWFPHFQITPVSKSIKHFVCHGDEHGRKMVRFNARRSKRSKFCNW